MPVKDRQDQSEFPLIQTTKGGVRFVRPIDIIRSRAGRKIIKYQVEENEETRTESPTIERGISGPRPLVRTENE
jgi:hypothetical protein